MDKVLEVKYGSIYRKDGSFIDNLAVVIDKEGGLMKWGERDNIKDYYNNAMEKYRAIPGLEEFANNQVYLEFDRYEGILSIEEICTFANYMIMCSANGSRIINILTMEESDMKKEIQRLKELGF